MSELRRSSLRLSQTQSSHSLLTPSAAQNIPFATGEVSENIKQYVRNTFGKLMEKQVDYIKEMNDSMKRDFNDEKRMI